MHLSQLGSIPTVTPERERFGRGKNPTETENSAGNSYDTCNNYSGRSGLFEEAMFSAPLFLLPSVPLAAPQREHLSGPPRVPARHADMHRVDISHAID